MTDEAIHPRPPLRVILAGMRPHAAPAVVSLAATLVFVVQIVAGRLALGYTIDAAAVQRSLHGFLIGTAVCGVLPMVAAGATLVEVRSMARFAQRYLRALRTRLLEHLYSMDIDFFSHERSGRLVTRLTSDVENVQQAVSSAFSLSLRAAATIVLTLVALFVQSPALTLTALFVLPPLLASTVAFSRVQFRAQSAARERVADTMVCANEALTGIQVVQAYSLEGRTNRAFERANAEMVAARRRTAVVAAAFLPIVELLSLVSMAAVLGVGGWLLSRHQVGVGAVLSAPFLVNGLFEPIQQLTELANTLQMAGASFGKVQAFLDEKPRITDAEDAVELARGAGALRIAGVRFRYTPDGPDVLRDIDLAIAPGERIALVAESGAGKTTLVKLIARFHDPTQGSLSIDGLDLRRVTSASLRRSLALVPQEGFLFCGTVEENIAAARPGATRADVVAACEALGMHDLVERLPQGLDTEVGNAGATLSAGQRQLVALARAFVADPVVLILDEVTSNVDPSTQAVLEHAFGTLLRGRTAIVVAHRVSTAMRSDRVVLLSGGRIVCAGPPHELLATRSAFTDWVGRDSPLVATDAIPAPSASRAPTARLLCAGGPDETPPQTVEVLCADA